MVGFSLMHIHPGLAITGLLGCLSVVVWLLPAIPCAIARRKTINLADLTMIAGVVLIVAALAIPDNFFA